MICIKEDCNLQASAAIAEDVLDVTITENRWVTDEPTFRKTSVYYCKEHFQEAMESLGNSRVVKEQIL
ncbi:hypothetical protein [[Acholeplasma] multilocale]|uniref:hypothetical protein n=1 Tax=[Acholeplasma] multilocale TaxID=264638 RepID=UPI00047B6149|nr:hypothetical protein [[Acholeplasma] multilocale]